MEPVALFSSDQQLLEGEIEMQTNEERRAAIDHYRVHKSTVLAHHTRQMDTCARVILLESAGLGILAVPAAYLFLDGDYVVGIVSLFLLLALSGIAAAAATAGKLVLRVYLAHTYLAALAFVGVLQLVIVVMRWTAYTACPTESDATAAQERVLVIHLILLLVFGVCCVPPAEYYRRLVGRVQLHSAGDTKNSSEEG